MVSGGKKYTHDIDFYIHFIPFNHNFSVFSKRAKQIGNQTTVERI